MKILITGGAGYIGSTIASLLKDESHTVIILDDLSAGKAEYAKGHIFYQGDIADGMLVDRIFREHPDIYATIHCAASMGATESVVNPQHYYENNLAKGIMFLGHLQRNRAYRYIFSSTGSMYDIADGCEVTETAALKPLSPYARTHMFLESALQDMAYAGKMRVVSLRYFNPIGADPQFRTGQYSLEPHHVLGKIVQADKNNQTFVITGTDWPTRDGSGIRDYVHVWDLAKAYLLALERFAFITQITPYQVINLGTGHGTTVYEFIRAYEDVTHHNVKTMRGPARPGDFPGAYVSSLKAKNLLGWLPELDIRTGIKDSLTWLGTSDSFLNRTSGEIPPEIRPRTSLYAVS